MNVAKKREIAFKILNNLNKFLKKIVFEALLSFIAIASV